MLFCGWVSFLGESMSTPAACHGGSPANTREDFIVLNRNSSITDAYRGLSLRSLPAKARSLFLASVMVMGLAACVTPDQAQVASPAIVSTDVTSDWVKLTGVSMPSKMGVRTVCQSRQAWDIIIEHELVGDHTSGMDALKASLDSGECMMVSAPVPMVVDRVLRMESLPKGVYLGIGVIKSGDKEIYTGLVFRKPGVSA